MRNKQQALNWLFENVTKWPTSAGGIISTPTGWKWGAFANQGIQLFKETPAELYTQCHITQQEWLDFTCKPVQSKTNPKKIYISGPMTGYKNFNREAFNARSRKITESGDIALNPAIFPDGLSTAEYMQICMAMVMCADEIYLLSGWDDSSGALAELSLAEKLGLTVIDGM